MKYVRVYWNRTDPPINDEYDYREFKTPGQLLKVSFKSRHKSLRMIGKCELI